MKRATIAACTLGLTQVVSWGILYYAFGVMAPAMQADLGFPAAQVYGAFSWAVLLAGLASFPVGVLIDRYGGRRVMATGSLLASAGVYSLAQCRSLAAYYFAWTLIGIGMAMSLYEAAFATLNRSLHAASRKAISTVTLFGGLASTVSWPLTAWMLRGMDWREACLAFALTLLAVCMPLHASLDDGEARTVDGQSNGRKHHALTAAVRQPVFWLLATVFAAHAFIFSALSVHMIPLLRKMGHSEQMVLGLVACIGPMQVVGRLIERGCSERISPGTVGVFTIAGLPLAIAVLCAMGGSGLAVAAFCILYGMSNGVLTILRGTLPQSIFGHANYGAITGALGAPSLMAKSGAPLLLVPLLRWDYRVLLGSMLGLALVSFLLYLLAMRAKTSLDASCGVTRGGRRA